MVGKTLGHYQITGQLGKGGMGEVYLAKDSKPGRIVAIKNLNEQHSDRFKPEARSIAAPNHTGIGNSDLPTR